MVASASHEVTGLLRAWSAGDQEALEQLLPVIYEQLRKLAHAHMARERPGHVLQTTALIHEAYLRLVDQRVEWRSRTQFFAVASRAMRRILVDQARGRAAAKRGGGAVQVSLHESVAMAGEKSSDLMAIDQALEKLEKLDSRQCRIVEMRFFGGLTIDEMAASLEISPATVRREWASAKAWLYRELSQG